MSPVFTANHARSSEDVDNDAWKAPCTTLFPRKGVTMRQLKHLLMTTAVAAVAWTVSVNANPWNEKTIMEFSEAVMVPGTTLQPGRYVFQIPDSATSSRHVIRIYTENEDRLITTIHAIPMKRLETTNDVVVRFSATEKGAPIAMKGWFYPGSTYGHQFIYSDDEAKQIAARTKTLVLSSDQTGTDMSTGTLHTYDAAGIRAAWQRDEATEREWRSWQEGRKGSGANAPTRGDTAQNRSSASTVSAEFSGKRVKLEDLENQPATYIGQKISVDGEVDQVLGPRLFTLDEPDWADLEGELLVYMPAPLAALVRDNDRVTVSGTVKSFVRADVEREWGWLTLSPQIEVQFSKKPVIIAERIIGGDSQRALMISAGPGTADRSVGTGGANTGNASAPITTSATLAAGDDEMVGRTVDLDGAKVTGLADKGGFFVAAAQDRQLFVLPHNAQMRSPAVGQSVSIDGTVMQMPDRMRDTLEAPGSMNRQIYVFASDIN